MGGCTNAMKKFLLLLMMLVMVCSCACAQEYDPIPWGSMDPAPYLPDPACYLPDNAGYQDESLGIRIETFRMHDTTVMAAYVKITDPSQLRTATAAKYPSKVARYVHIMSEDNNAVMAINGDWFSQHTDGIVIRNGVSMRVRPNKGRDTLIIDANGDFTILHPTSDESWGAFEGEVIHAFCFGPGLVIDGEVLTDVDSIMLSCGKNKKTQRMAIGQTGPLQYLILTCEGPENEGSVGMDILQWAQLCKDMGMENAYNLDGGSSSTLVLNNQKINSLSSNKVRTVGDCIYFASLVPYTPPTPTPVPTEVPTAVPTDVPVQE